MGRNKFSEAEIADIGRLLQKKLTANRRGQKLIRHTLRVDFGFSISDFGQQGKAFGPNELKEALRRGAISIVDEQTAADMRARYAAKREADRAGGQPAAASPQADWHRALDEWNAWQQAESGDRSAEGDDK